MIYITLNRGADMKPISKNKKIVIGVIIAIVILTTSVGAAMLIDIDNKKADIEEQLAL